MRLNHCFSAGYARLCITYSNGMQAVPTIRNDALIEGVDPTTISVNGSIDVRFADTVLVDDAINNTAIELELAYKLAGLEGNNFSLTWTFHEVYLPRPRIPVSGPGGVQASFNWQGVYDDTNSDAAKEALAALNASTKAKIADANKQDAKSAPKDDSEDKRKRAIEEINRGILQTKPSYDVAKQALDDWKARVIEDLGGATEANQKYVDLIEQIYSVKLKDIYNKSLLDSDKWEDGASRALKRYADQATNAAKNAEDLFGSAASKVEDTLVDMVGQHGRRRMQEPSFRYRRPFFLCRAGTFSPSCRQIRSTRL